MSHETDTHIILRTSKAGNRKSAYVRAANSENLNLANWCFKHLDHAAGYDESKAMGSAQKPTNDRGGVGGTGSSGA